MNGKQSWQHIAENSKTLNDTISRITFFLISITNEQSLALMGIRLLQKTPNISAIHTKHGTYIVIYFTRLITHFKKI